MRIPESYELTGAVLALAVNAGLLYSIGIRGVWLVVCMAVLYLPVNWVVGVLVAAIFPPRLEPSGGTSLLEGHDGAP